MCDLQQKAILSQDTNFSLSLNTLNVPQHADVNVLVLHNLTCYMQCFLVTVATYLCEAYTLPLPAPPPPPFSLHLQGFLGDSEDNISGRWLRRHSKNLSCTVVCSSTVIVSSRFLPRFLLHTVQ